MVSRETRDHAKRLIERFYACEITSDDFDADYPSREKDDKALGAIYETLWFYWDDRHTHKLTGKHQLDPEGRALFERCTAFLATDLEYEWPPIQRVSFSRGLLRMIGLRKVADKKAGQYIEGIRRSGKWEVWPFIRKEDHNRLVHPTE